MRHGLTKGYGCFLTGIVKDLGYPEENLHFPLEQKDNKV